MLKKGYVFKCPDCGTPALKLARDIKLGSKASPQDFEQLGEQKEFFSQEFTHCSFCSRNFFKHLLIPENWSEPEK